MKVRVKKILKRAAITFSVLIVLAMTTIFIVLKYKLNDTIKYLVEMESNGCFAINIGKSDYSYWQDRIILNDIELTNQSCSEKAIKKLSAKKVILDVKGIYPMVFGHDYHINRLYIDGITFNIELKKQGKHLTFKEELEKIHSKLAKIGGNFHMENIHLKHANIGFVQGNNNMQLNNIEMRITAFRKNENTQRFDAQFKIKLPNHELKFNKNIVRFDQLTLDENRGLRIKNFTLLQEVPKIPGAFNSIKGEELQLTIEQDFFSKNDFVVDSLYFTNVQVVNYLVGKNIEKNISSVQKQFKPESIFQLFPSYTLKYIHLANLTIQLPENSKRKHDFNIHQKGLLLTDLKLNDSTGVSCQRLQLIDDKIKIHTDDKQDEIQFSAFSFENNTIGLFDPTFIHKNKNKVDDHISLKQIKLVNLNITQALKMDFRASSVQFYSPKIHFKSNKKSKLQTPINYDAFNEFATTKVKQIAKFFKVFKIELYDGEIHLENPNSKTDIYDLNMVFNSENIVNSSHIFYYPDKFKRLTIGRLEFKDKNTQLKLQDAHLHFLENSYHFGYVKLSSPEIEAHIKNLDLIELDILGYIQTNKVELDLFEVEKLDLTIKTKSNKEKKNKDLPEISIDSINIKETAFQLFKNDIKQTRFEINESVFSQLKLANKELSYSHSDATIDHIFLRNTSKKLDFEIENLIIHDKNIELNKFGIKNTDKKNQFNLVVPVMDIDFASSNFNKESLDIDKIKIPKSTIKLDLDFVKSLLHETSETNPQSNKTIALPQLNIREVDFEDLALATSIKSKGFNMSGDFILNLKLKDLKQDHYTITKSIKKELADLPLRLQMNLGLSGNISHYDFKDNFGSVRKISVENNRNIDQNTIEELLRNPLELSDFLKLSMEGVILRTKKTEFHCSELAWHNLDKQIVVNDIKIEPRITKKQHFDAHDFESVFMHTTTGNLKISKVSVSELVHEKKYVIPRVDLENFVVHVSKDKSKPLEPGVIKPMFTDILMNLKKDLIVHEVYFKNLTLPYEERHQDNDDYIAMNFSKMTGKVSNITSKPGPTDSLTIEASLYLNEMPIKHFFYRESYLDTLSAFRMHLHMAKTDLTGFTAISKPLVNLEITSGHCDSLTANIQGNKLAAYGKMTFVYSNLAIQLDSNDRVKSRFLLNIINSTANNYLLRKRNKKTSYVFTERDNKRMVINLWVKSLISGLFTSTGIKSNRKYQKKIKQNKAKYYL